jgi:hypothetical protein
MSKTRWKAFSYADAYEYSGAKLAKSWARLHRGDCEPFPDPASLLKLAAVHPQLNPSISWDKAAETLTDAWRAYHRGAFGQAVALGLGLGLVGYNVANKAARIYGTYLETGPKAKLTLFREAARRAEEGTPWLRREPFQCMVSPRPGARPLCPGTLGDPGAGGRLGGKIKSSLQQTITLERHHADAHIALGAYHAEVINKIGALIGDLTYATSTDAGVKHCKTALKLNPHSAIARIEYAKGLVKMFGKAETTPGDRTL